MIDLRCNCWMAGRLKTGLKYFPQRHTREAAKNVERGYYLYPPVALYALRSLAVNILVFKTQNRCCTVTVERNLVFFKNFLYKVACSTKKLWLFIIFCMCCKPGRSRFAKKITLDKSIFNNQDHKIEALTENQSRLGNSLEIRLYLYYIDQENLCMCQDFW